MLNAYERQLILFYLSNAASRYRKVDQGRTSHWHPGREYLGVRPTGNRQDRVLQDAGCPAWDAPLQCRRRR